jgi:cytochrome c
MKYLISTAAALMLLGCGSQQKEEKSTQQPAAKETPAPAAAAPEAAEAVTATEAVTETKTEPETAASTETAAETVKETAEAVQESAAVAAENVEAGAAEAVEETAAAIEETAATEPAVDGAALFAQKCASCHGMNAEKPALGKSRVIAGWDAAKTESALKGYIDGTYGGAMKAVMQGQAKALDDAQISAVAEYIGSL